MTPAGLAALLRLMEARRSRDLARLDRLLAEERALADEIAALAALPARDLAEDPAQSPAQQARRLAWAAQRIRLAERRRAALADAIRAARAAAAQSLGKHKSLEMLADRAGRAALLARDARAEREAPPPVSQGGRLS
jgi:hypothetical protein